MRAQRPPAGASQDAPLRAGEAEVADEPEHERGDGGGARRAGPASAGAAAAKAELEKAAPGPKRTMPE